MPASPPASASATPPWCGRGPKPATGVQAAAREARYRLMASTPRQRHRRAADGPYSGRPGRDPFDAACPRQRPRWSGRHGAVRASGRLAGAAAPASTFPRRACVPRWRPAPSPGSRTRATNPPPSSAPACGPPAKCWRALGLTNEMLALTARRLQRARTRLEAIDRQLLRRPGGGPHRPLRPLSHRPGAARPSARGGPAARARPVHRRGRRVGRARASGQARADRRQAAPQQGHAAASWTLARALISAAPEAIQIEREPGRQPPARLTLAGGDSSLWDGRFAVAVAASFEGTLEVRALGAEGLADLRRLGRPTKSVRFLHLLPSFWRASALVAVPGPRFLGKSRARGADFGRICGLALQHRRAWRHSIGGIGGNSLSICSSCLPKPKLSAANLANNPYTPMLQQRHGPRRAAAGEGDELGRSPGQRRHRTAQRMKEPR